MNPEPQHQFRPGAKVTEYRNRTVRKRVMQRRSNSQIAAELGINIRTVTRIRSRIGLTAHQNGPLTAGERSRIEDMLDDGCAYAEIARTIGRDVDTIQRNYPNRSTFTLLGRYHLKLAEKLGLQVIW